MPQVDLDMVRLGIAMYGMYPSDEVKKKRWNYSRHWI